ncbi:MAG: MotA/TolQ/ExbB proton channel family protein, partial [Pseudomonadota bacterium]
MNDTTGIITSNIATKQIDLSVLGMIMGADIIVQFVLLILAIASVWSWAVIIDKSILLRNIGKKINEFESIFWSGQLLDKLYDRVRHQPDNPMAVVFVSAMDEWNKQSHMESRNQNAYSYLRVSLKNRIMQAMDNSKNKELEKLFKNLSFLAVVGSSATFIGVFGTVWGIMS